jgi:hypothetical protein
MPLDRLSVHNRRRATVSDSHSADARFQQRCRSGCELCFGDGTIGAITFSAKGHTFEGVREYLCGHKGNLLFGLRDFKELTTDVIDRKRRFTGLFRDHGHRANILGSYEATFLGKAYDRSAALSHLSNTAWLFLKSKQALEENRTLSIGPFVEGERAIRQVEPRAADIGRYQTPMTGFNRPTRPHVPAGARRA